MAKRWNCFSIMLKFRFKIIWSFIAHRKVILIVNICRKESDFCMFFIVAICCALCTYAGRARDCENLLRRTEKKSRGWVEDEKILRSPRSVERLVQKICKCRQLPVTTELHDSLRSLPHLISPLTPHLNFLSITLHHSNRHFQEVPPTLTPLQKTHLRRLPVSSEFLLAR